MGNQKKGSSQLLKGFFVVILSLIFSSCETVHDVTITESEEGVWRLFDDNNINRGTLVVEPGDRIVWNTTNSDVIFGFPLDMEKYLEVREGEFTKTDGNIDWPESESTDSNERRIQEVSEGEMLRLTVREDSPEVRIDYDIYIVGMEEFVVGNSPPYLQIQRPYD